MELVINQKNKSCQCKEGYSLGRSNSCEKIHLTNSMNDKECTDSMAKRDPVTNKCECIAGFTRDFFGFCSQDCKTSNSYWDYDTKKCECFNGHKMVGEKCVEI